MDQLRLAHGLGDLVPCVKTRIKQRVVIGGHSALPPLYLQRFVDRHFPLADPVPPLVEIRTILHHCLKCASHQQPHDEVVGNRSEGNGERKHRPVSGLFVENGQNDRPNHEKQRGPRHFLCHIRSPHSENVHCVFTAAETHGDPSKNADSLFLLELLGCACEIDAVFPVCASRLSMRNDTTGPCKKPVLPMLLCMSRSRSRRAKSIYLTSHPESLTVPVLSRFAKWPCNPPAAVLYFHRN